MAFLNDIDNNNNIDCGCDNNYYSSINSSPLLSGQQENVFNPDKSNLNKLNNSNANNMSANNNNNMNMNNLDLGQILNQNQNQNQNQHQQNNAVNEQNIQNILNSIPDTTKRNNPLPDVGSMRNNNEQIELNTQILQNLNNLNNNLNNNNTDVVQDEQSKYILTMFNYVLVVMVALAVNDLAKYYINRSIKFSNGTHMYYVYYSVGLVLLTYIISKSVNKM
jgi:hypothetical protein